jgi:hypothetical protein
MDNTSKEACLDRFLGITAEIRVMIYKAYLNDFEITRLTRDRPVHVPRLRWRPRPTCGNSSGRGRPLLAPSHPTTSPPRKQTRHEAARRTVLDSICETHLEAAQAAELPITSGAIEAFQRYKLEHDMYVTRCWHEQHHVNGDNALEIFVNERGNMCDDLPMWPSRIVRCSLKSSTCSFPR